MIACMVAPPRSVARTDVGVVALDDVDRRFLRGCRAAVDPGVMRDQVGFANRVGSLVLGYEAAGPRIRTVVEQKSVDVLICRVFVAVDVLGWLIIQARASVRLFFGEQFVQGLAVLLLLREPHPR